jgi:hypothetical protein
LITDKDVDGIRGIKTTAAINARDKEVSAQIMALKKPATTDEIYGTIRIARPEQSRQEMRQDVQKSTHKESLTKPQLI